MRITYWRSISIVSGLLVIVFAAGLFSPADGKESGRENNLSIKIRPDKLKEAYYAQLLGALDIPVKDTIALHTTDIPARINEKQELEIDLKGTGSFRVYRKDVSIPLKLEIKKAPSEKKGVVLPGSGTQNALSVTLDFKKHADGSWTYRNATVLDVQINKESFTVIDANGNGRYNEPGVDGITWKGCKYFFPLPAKEERWCSDTMEFTGLEYGPWGENPKVQGAELATTVAEALDVLKGTNIERVKIGLTPRPEDKNLSADLQKHCEYMFQNKQLTHPETSGRPGYTPEGHAAGMRSILSQGTPPRYVALSMVMTFFHRIDVIRPGTLAFGVGTRGAAMHVFSGIDGRTSMAPNDEKWWPVLCPVPDQENVPTYFSPEEPDPIKGDKSAGFPVTVYFSTDDIKLKNYEIVALGGKGKPEPLVCYTFDPTIPSPLSLTKFQKVAAIIPKEPLAGNTVYQVTMAIEVKGAVWEKTWTFTTGAAPAAGRRSR